jgi:PKD repeat protein
MKYWIVLIIVLNTYRLNAQNQLISFSNSSQQNNIEARRSIIDNGLDGVSVQYEFDNAMVHYQVENSTYYQYFYIKDFTQSQEVGYPMLPVHTDLIMIPKDANLSIQVQDSVSSYYNNFLIYPALEPVSDQFGASSPLFETNTLAYQSNNFYPKNLVELKGIISIRGIRYAMIEVHPIQYRASDGKLRLNGKINYKVSFVGASQFIDFDEYSYRFMRSSYNLPLNNQFLKTAIEHYISLNPQEQRNTEEPNYLIITHQDFTAAADSLAKWKSQLGYFTEIITDIQWTSEKISNLIQSYYSNQNKKPEYILFLGSPEKVPTAWISRNNSSFDSDQPYTCLDGINDHFSDVSYGRIAVNNAEQAKQVIAKIIQYEQFPNQDSNFYQTISNIGQFESEGSGYEKSVSIKTSETIDAYLRNKNYSLNRLYTAAAAISPSNYNNTYYSAGEAIATTLKRPNYAWNKTAYDIRQAFNTGNFLITYYSSSWSGGWSNPSFNKTDLSMLNNNGKFPLIVSLGGNIGQSSDPNNLAKNLLLIKNGGAIGILAHSKYSFSIHNAAINLGIIDAIWPNPGLLPDYQTTYNGFPRPSHYNLTSIGDLKNQSLLQMITLSGSDTNLIQQMQESMVVYGDPSLRLWTQKPDSIIVGNINNLNCSTDTSLIITANTDALASLMIGDKIIAISEIINGSCNLYFNDLSGDKAILTLSAENKIPCIIEIPIVGNCPKADFSLSAINYCITDSFLVTNASNHYSTNCIWNFGQGGIPSQAFGLGPFYIQYTSAGLKTIQLSLVDSNGITQSELSKTLIIDSLCANHLPMEGNDISYDCHGWLRDNGHTAHYSNNILSSYTISPSGASQVNIVFSEVELVGNDQINLYDGPNINSPLLLSIDSNTQLSSSIISSGGSITIEQNTDAKGHAAGFLLAWNCIINSHLPQAKFYTNDSISCNSDIQFYDLSTGGIDNRIWDFGDNTFSTQQHPKHRYLQNGNYTVQLTVSNANGSNSLTKSNYVNLQQINQPTITDVYRCHFGKIDLSVSASVGEFRWYDSDIAGQLLGIGKTLNPTLVDTITTFYVEGVQYQYHLLSGKPDTSGQGFYSQPQSNEYLQFDVMESAHLISVDLYAQNAGRTVLKLINSAQELIQLSEVSLNAGKNKIHLNWDIQAGINYSLRVSSDVALYQNFNQVIYPIANANQVIITASSDPSHYYYAYHWQIRGDACISPRTEVRAVVSDTLSAIAEFSYHFNANQLILENNSQYADSYYWEFGDGDFSLEASPTHQYANVGLYTVKLIASNTCGNSAIIKQITIQNSAIHSPTAINQLRIYPNPATNLLNIEFQLLQTSAVKLKLYNTIGQVVMKKNLYETGIQQQHYMDISRIAKGVYVLELSTAGETYRNKIIKE